MENRLWAAAQFDGYVQTGTVWMLLDRLGLPVVEASGYKQTITAAVARYGELKKARPTCQSQSGSMAYTYTDQEFDDETGLYNYDARALNLLT